MMDRDWALEDAEWAVLGMVVILGLVVLNAYVQRISRIAEEERQLKLAGSDPLDRDRSVASQSRRT